MTSSFKRKEVPNEVLEKSEKIQILIIGGGPAGYTAGIYASRAGFKPVLLQGQEPGGQLMITTEVENYPGFMGAGPDLMENMEKQCSKQGCDIRMETCTYVDLSVKPFIVETDNEKYYLADTLLICTGSTSNWLGLESEKRLQNHGISGCATCDGPLYKGKDVCVVGGGDAAMEEALFLSRICNVVHVIHRRDELRASKIMQERAFKTKNIIFQWSYVVKEFVGEKKLTSVKLISTKNRLEKEIEVSAAFIAIGHSPKTELFKGQLSLDSTGYIITNGVTCDTSVPGVFACGDVRDKVYRQAITSAGFGCMGAFNAEKYIDNYIDK